MSDVVPIQFVRELMDRIDANTKAQGETTEEVRGLRRDMKRVLSHFSDEPTLPGRVQALEDWRAAEIEAKRQRDADARTIRNRVVGSLIVIVIVGVAGLVWAGINARQGQGQSEVSR